MNKSKFKSRVVVFVVSTVLPLGVAAQQKPTLEEVFDKLDWQAGPATSTIASKATVQVQKGYFALAASDTNQFLEAIGNLPSTADRYLVGKQDLSWFAVFQFSSEGYVRDDEKIDADALLSTLKETNRKSNEERERLGLNKMVLVGWSVPPFYNKQTKRLEWGLDLRGEGGSQTINYTSRILGRSGYMAATLVADPANFEIQQKEFNAALESFSYIKGESYSEFKEGDKVAQYGLAALVAGGAAAAVVKSKGLWKLIGAGIIAGFVALWATLKRVLGRSSKA